MQLKRWSRLFRLEPRDEVEDELRHHLEQRVDDYMAQGLDPAAAREAAERRLGRLDPVVDECTRLLSADRRAKHRRWLLRISWLDVKLGARMMAKYPGLSAVSVISLAVAIALGAGWFGFLGAMFDPSLPLSDGERIVSLRNRDLRSPPSFDRMEFSDRNPDRQSLHDFFIWRDELHSVTELSAFRTDARNLSVNGSVELVQVAEMTASGFRVARVSPLLGRAVIDEDERSSAPPVVVIGYDEWQRRFDGDRGVVGRDVKLGSTVHTIVGVMPEGFRFPIHHRFWVPLRLDARAFERGSAPAVNVFGRLADDVTMEQAQAELSTIGRRLADELPESHEHLRPHVMRYAHAFYDMDASGKPWVLVVVQNIYVMLVLLIAVNVAILIYARSATRVGEIAVRTALGASRTRVVSQLFVEALVLSAVAATVGLVLAGIGLSKMKALWERGLGELPFWTDIGLSPAVVAYAIVLTVVAAGVVGVLPALKATGRRVQPVLQLYAARGARLELGGLWTLLIIVQVALAVLILPGTINTSLQMLRESERPQGYAAPEFIRARLALEGAAGDDTEPLASGATGTRVTIAAHASELIRRLESDPAVADVTFARSFPGREQFAYLEVEGAAGAPAEFISSAVNHVAIDFFRAFDAPVHAGRSFVSDDAAEGAAAVIVSRSFAEEIGSGADVLGRRIRRVIRRPDAEPGEVENGPWLEIVGVVHDFPAPPYTVPSPPPRLYQPITLDRASILTLMARTRGVTPPSFATRLRDIAAGVDPALQLHDVRRIADDLRMRELQNRYAALGMAGVTLCVVLLAAAGIHAMMAFTVARRRREIGIRAALGANARRLVSGIFARAAAQLGAGVMAGLVIAGYASRSGSDELWGGSGVLFVLPVVALFIVAVGLLAAWGPARRGLAVQPTEALRAE